MLLAFVVMLVVFSVVVVAVIFCVKIDDVGMLVCLVVRVVYVGDVCMALIVVGTEDKVDLLVD